jgi:hypothetical protein
MYSRMRLLEEAGHGRPDRLLEKPVMLRVRALSDPSAGRTVVIMGGLP